MRLTALVPTVAIAATLWGCAPSSEGRAEGKIEVTSSAFADGAGIPARHSCEDENLSPPLMWKGVPDEAVEVAVVVRDPDAPDGTFFHWLVLGLDPQVEGLGEGSVPAGAVQAKSSSENPTYIGMCPPDGEEHEYVFSVHGLDESLAERVVGLPATEAVALIEEHTIAEGSLRGRFGR